MILLPYAHERQTVQRLPYITFGLIVLNFVIFLFTHYGGHSVEDLYDQLAELHEYASTHPYLEIPQEGRHYFDRRQLQQLDALREATNLRDLDPEQLREEQRTLNSLVQSVKDVEGENPYAKWGYTPAEPSVTGLFTSMFIHGGWLHLIGNMFFLYLAGCSIEDLWGRPLYSGFYVLSGIAATVIHAVKFAGDTEPLVGASGAIAGLMGAFLVRLYDTKISFFYAVWFWIRGTFKAPAYIMLPLWLLQQIFYAMVDESGSVAFYAHIGGFVFGALFAFGIKRFEIEEKYIAPKIEKKVGLAQHPDFLRAMNLSEQGNYPDALILLHRVVREDPNHLEAYMEMRRISEINKDFSAYNKYSIAIFEILLRTRDWDLLLDLYKQFQGSSLRQPLPPKSLLGLGIYFEETLDYASAANHYEELCSNYPQDPLAMKAHSKLARLYLEKVNSREKGIENYWRSYHHPHADSQWRAALLIDRKRYQIPDEPDAIAGAAIPAAAVVVPAVAASTQVPKVVESRPAAAENPAVPDDSTQSMIPEAAPDPVRASHYAPADSERVVLPNLMFDGEITAVRQVVRCRLEKLTLKGLNVRNKDQSAGLLPWKRVRMISVGRIRMIDPSGTTPQRTFLVLDLICADTPTVAAPVYRLLSDEIAFEKIFPGVEQSFEEAFQNFMGIVVKNSGARCIPNAESCTGPNFATYPDLSRYESRLKERLARA